MLVVQYGSFVIADIEYVWSLSFSLTRFGFTKQCCLAVSLKERRDNSNVKMCQDYDKMTHCHKDRQG